VNHFGVRQTIGARVLDGAEAGVEFLGRELIRGPLIFRRAKEAGALVTNQYSHKISRLVTQIVKHSAAILAYPYFTDSRPGQTKEGKVSAMNSICGADDAGARQEI